MIDIPHDPKLSNGTWRLSEIPDNVLLKCPKGHIGILDHDISDEGTVNPSVQCMECDFHEYVRLLDWKK